MYELHLPTKRRLTVPKDSLPKFFLECWTHCSALSVVDQCDTWAANADLQPERLQGHADHAPDLARVVAELPPLDAPERLALWPQLAEANAGVGDERRNEAAVCWTNALWTRADATWVAGWYRTERPDGPLPVTAAEFDARLRPNPPTPGEMRAFAAAFLAAADHAPPPA